MQRSGRIALTAFWARRVRRLMPALVVLLLVVAVVTALTATYSQRTSIRGDLLATVTYVANWRFIATSSYFVNTGVSSPLQHTWSLAIEEQFYLAWPLLLAFLILIVKRPLRTVAIPALIGAALSVAALAVLWSVVGVDRAYMGTDARIFEPLIGALGAVVVASPAGESRAGTCRHAAGRHRRPGARGVPDGDPARDRRLLLRRSRRGRRVDPADGRPAVGGEGRPPGDARSRGRRWPGWARSPTACICGTGP